MSQLKTNERKIMSQRSTKPDELDSLLESLGLYRKRIPRDGNSLFRVVADQLLGSQRYYPLVRNNILNYFWENRSEVEQIMSAQSQYPNRSSFMEYMIQKCLTAIRAVYNVNLRVYREPALNQTNCCYLSDISSGSSQKPTIVLSVDSELRWDSVYSHEHMQAMAFCQAVVYDILYKDVFALENVDYSVAKMLDKTNKFSLVALREGFGKDLVLKMMHGDFTPFNGVKDLKSLADQGVPPFPYKVAKSLNMNIYRNVEYDVWDNIVPRTSSYLVDAVLELGGKCLVHVNDKMKYIGYVQHINEEQGSVMVFVEKLAGIRVFSIADVEAIPYHPHRKFRTSRRYYTNNYWRRNASDLAAAHAETTNVGRTEERSTPSVEKNARNLPVDENNDDPNSFESSYSHGDKETESLGCGSAGDPQSNTEVANSFFDNASGLPVHLSPVNLAAGYSYSLDGKDLPVQDVTTLRYFYNQGIQYMQALQVNMVTGMIQGGYAAATATENVLAGIVQGDYAAATPTESVIEGMVQGGYAAATPTENAMGGMVQAGYAAATSTENILAGMVQGGYAAATPTGNAMGGMVQGGYATATSTENVMGGLVQGCYSAATENVMGGMVQGGYAAATPTENVFAGMVQGCYSASTSTENVIGGMVQRGFAAATPTESVMGSTAVPNHATMIPQIPPGTPMTPVTPTEAPFYQPQFYTSGMYPSSQQYQDEMQPYIHDGAVVDGLQWMSSFLPQCYVAATPTSGANAAPHWSIAAGTAYPYSS